MRFQLGKFRVASLEWILCNAVVAINPRPTDGRHWATLRV